MGINAKLNIPKSVKDIVFGDTTIKWSQQELEFIYNGGKRYIHKLTQGQWNYLVNGLQSLMGNIPNISEIEIPDFDPDIE